MFLRSISESHMRKAAAWMRLAVAFCLLALTLLQGLTFCLCVPDPDGCGAECHDCGSIPEPANTHMEHICDHLEIAVVPPGVAAPKPLNDNLADALVVIAAFQPPCAKPQPPDAFSRFFGRPPDVPPPQLIFIARSAQILC